VSNSAELITFGPVPSRRLGRSLGINNIPPKVCTYSCIYCQLGPTSEIRTERQGFYGAEDVFREVRNQINRAMSRGEAIDYLSFVPDGEPTLDVDLGKTINLLKRLDIRIAVITNGSLAWRRDVREDLGEADLVSFKIDAADSNTWTRINRGHRSLRFERVLEGMNEFAATYDGELITETMMVENVNDSPEALEGISGFIRGLKPRKSYVAIPTRPPAEEWARPSSERTLNAAYQMFREGSIDVEYLIGYEGNAFAFTGNAEEDLLSITSVHPMREDGVREYLAKAGADWALVERLTGEKKLVTTEYRGKTFYMRKLPYSKRLSGARG
jgi:wyosine [tRNA(Phe)-imidazoG37] synthetase (radical SAM superfamily)